MRLPNVQRISFFVLRVVSGLLFFASGLGKILTDWSATGYLNAASGPFAGFFQSMAGSPVVDALNSWGMLLIGVALIIGFGTRIALFFAALLMVLYYFAQFEANTAHGLIDEHVMYFVAFFVMAAHSVGAVWGVDAWVMRQKWFKKTPWLAYLIG